MFLRLGTVILCLLAEIGVGIYTYFHFESLLTRFLFFVFTAICFGFLVIKIAGQDLSQKRKTTFDNQPPKKNNNSKDRDPRIGLQKINPPQKPN